MRFPRGFLISAFLFPLTFLNAPLAGASDAHIKLELKNEFSIRDLQSIAFERNPGLKAAKARWKAVIERHPQVTALEDPEIGIDTWNIPTDFAFEDTKTKIYWVSQEFPFPGKLKIKGDIVSQDVKTARTQFEIATRDLMTELESSYYELLYLDKAIVFIQKNKKLAGKLAKISATELSKDATTLNDVLKAQAQLGQLDNDLILLTELRMSEAALINSRLQYPPDRPLGHPRDIAFIPFDFELNNLYRLTKEHQQELRVNGFEIEKGRKKIELAKKRYYPDFRATFKWFENEGVPMDNGVGILFGVKVPIWLQKNRSRVSEARNELRALEYEKADLENKAFAEVNKVYFQIQNSSRLVRLYKESLIPQAVQSMEIAETWYRQDKGSFSGLLEARAIWLNFHLAYNRALSDYFQHIARMENIIGVNLEIAKKKEIKQ